MKTLALILLSCCFISHELPFHTSSQVAVNTEVGYYFVSENETALSLRYSGHNKSHFLEPKPFLTSADFEALEIREETWPGLPWTHTLTISLSKRGIMKWEEGTERAAKERLQIAFVMEDEIITVLTVMSINKSGKASIFARNLTKEDLTSIKKKLEK